MNVTRREALLAGTSLALNAAGAMPTVEFGGATISRLIVGGNPVSGNSHVDNRLSQEMVDYFTSAKIKKMLQDCEANGVNAWQSRGDRHILRILHEYRQEGGRIHWIGQSATEIDFRRNIAEMARERPLGIYLHGNRTDTAWASGNIDSVQDMLKQIRQTGTRVGLGTHNPLVIDYVESKNWDVDFYMTCVFNLTRSEAEKERIAGRPHPDELFHDADRQEMLKRVAKTSKPCLIFKVYGATRHCGSEAQMQAALKLAATYAKPTDALVIGMFPKYSDQVPQNARLVRQAFSTS